MKNFVKRAFCGVFALAIAFSVIGCSTPDNIGDSGDVQIEVDEKRTQLYVFNYASGYGTEWMSKAIEEYEKLHAEDVYEEGKVGVQIVPTHLKKKRDAAEILQNKEEVYFTESVVQYYQAINEGAFADITDAVVGANAYETEKNIESKLTDAQKSYYGYQKDGKTVYYGIPHYSGAFGIIYDMDLFEEKGFYFKDGYKSTDALEEHFIYAADDKKSAGPDGEYKTADDGLPTTYTEFLELCEYISSIGLTPIGWSGANYAGYLTMLYNQLVVNDAGLEESLLTYTMDGTTDKLGKVNENGEFVKDAASTTITPDTAYELYRHESKYTALQFLKSLIETNKYHNDTAFTNTHEQTTAQDDFLWSGKDNMTKSMAMLADGVWWQAEANETFKAMETQVSAWGKKSRNFGWMPLPRSEQKDQKNVYFDTLYSMCFIKKNIASWKMDLAVDFLQFMHTDASLKQFTTITNTPKAYNYTMSETELAELTPFGRSVFEYKQNGDVLYPVSNEPKFLNNQSIFAAGEGYKATLDIDQMYPSMTFHEKGVSAKAYFDGMYTYWKKKWSTLN